MHWQELRQRWECARRQRIAQDYKKTDNQETSESDQEIRRVCANVRVIQISPKYRPRSCKDIPWRSRIDQDLKRGWLNCLRHSSLYEQDRLLIFHIFIQKPIQRMSKSGRGYRRVRRYYRGSGHGRSRRIKSPSNFNYYYYEKKEVKFSPHGHKKPQLVTYSTVKNVIL